MVEGEVYVDEDSTRAGIIAMYDSDWIAMVVERKQGTMTPQFNANLLLTLPDRRSSRATSESQLTHGGQPADTKQGQRSRATIGDPSE